ncbi:MAG: hypothetical protein GAK41_01395 [Burkholderia gladioli]|nr:MAG: hypothetical protein GAK41_01395 [Burkholderia gladioli]
MLRSPRATVELPLKLVVRQADDGRVDVDYRPLLNFEWVDFSRVKGGRSPAQRTLDAEKSTSPSGGEDFPALGRG